MAIGDPVVDPATGLPLAQPSFADFLAQFGGGGAPPPIDASLAGAPAGVVAPPPDLAAPDLAPPGAVAPPDGADAPPAPPPPIDASLLGAPQPLQPPFVPLDVPPDLPAPPPYGAPSLAPPPSSPGLVPDAISGPTPDTVTTLPGLDISIDRQPTDEEKLAARVAADPFAQHDNGPLAPRYELSDAELRNRLAGLPQEQLAAIQLQHDAARENEFAARRLEASNRAVDEARANAIARQRADEATQQKLQAIEEDAKRLSNTKIDPSGNLSTGQKIAGILASLIGGLVQGRTGSSVNAGLQSFTDTINRSVEAQKSEIARQLQGIGQQRSALSQEFERHGDLFRAQEALRVSLYDQAINQAQFEAQNYDPRGTTALKYAQVVQGLGAQRATALRDAAQKEFDNRLKQFEAERQIAIAQATADNNRAQLGLGYARLAEDRAQREQAERFKRDEKQAARDEKAAETERQLSIGALPRLKLDEKGKPLVSDNGAPVVESGPLRQTDGSVFLAPDQGTRTKLADQTLAASEINDIINEVLDIRSRVGGETDLANSPEAQRLHVLKDRITLIAKSGTEGLSSDKDLERIEGALGAKNVASFRDQTAGLEAARERVNAELNKQYRLARYTGAKIEFPNKFGASPKETNSDIKAQRLFEKPNAIFNDELNDELKRRTVDFSPDQVRAGYPRELLRRTERDVRALYDPDISIEQRREIERLGSLAGGDTPEAASARTLLQSLSERAQTAKIRETAANALRAGIDASAPYTPEEIHR